MSGSNRPSPSSFRGEVCFIPPQLLLTFLFVLPFILAWPLVNKTELPQWQAAMLLGPLAGMVWLFISRQPLIWSRMHTLVILTLTASLYLSLLHTGTPGVQQGLQQQVTLALFFFLGAQYLSTERGRRRLLEVTVLSASLVALIGVTQHLTGSTLGLPARSAAASVFINKNYAGAFMDLATPAAFLLLLAADNRRSRLWSGTAFLLCLSYSLITLSRGHWLALAVALGLLLILFRRNPAIRRRLVAQPSSQRLAALIMLAAPLVLLAPSLSGETPLSSSPTATQLSASGSISDRFGFYRNTLQLIQDHPLAGIGPGAFYSGFRDYYGTPSPLPLTTELIGIAHAHNDYLEYLAELGILGGLVMITLLATVWYSAWRLAGDRTCAARALTGAAFLSGITAILSHAVVDFPLSLPVSSIYLWTWAGALSSIWRPVSQPQSAGGPAFTPADRRLRRLLGGLALIYLGLVGFQAYQSLKADYLIRQAAKASIAKRCDEALALSDEAFDLAPRDYLIWHHHLLVNNFCNPSLKGQLMASARVLEQDPNHPYALLTGANVLYQAGDMMAATALYQRLIDLLPHRISGYLGIANILMAKGDESAAADYYRRAEKARKQIRDQWYPGPAGRTLAALTVRASGDLQWAAPVRKPRNSIEIRVAGQPTVSGGGGS